MPVIATIPEISTEEVRFILRDLAAEGKNVPEPQAVKVEAGEDHEGNPAYILTVTYGRQHKPESIPWRRISPLVHRLSRKVFLSGGGDYIVLPTLRRLAEKLPRR
jgi:hypothetical protein